MTRSRYKIYDTIYPHFLTCTVVGWMPIFTRPETTDVVFDSLRFLQENDRLALFGYVLLENHLHLVAGAEDLSKEIGDFKSFTARKLIDFLKERRLKMFLDQLKYYKERHKIDQDYQLWQEGSHPQMIQNDEMMRQKLDYIHFNPIKRGFVDDPVHWRCSSARNYAGQEGVIPVTTQW
ncbi:MAG: transposase [Candidatus Nealsonbacteria bacterium]|nr:transposase [Candidatus Nealsonbacteria bacterium]